MADWANNHQESTRAMDRAAKMEEQETLNKQLADAAIGGWDEDMDGETFEDAEEDEGDAVEDSPDLGSDPPAAATQGAGTTVADDIN